MGVGAVTINGVNVTSIVDQSSFSAEFQANQLNSTCKFVVVDGSRNTGGTPIEIREQDEVIVTDDGTRIFGGRVAIPTPSAYGKNVLWDIQCVGFDVILDNRVIESGSRTGTRSDANDVAYIAGYASDLGLGFSTYVATLKNPLPGDINYSGLTLRQALTMLAEAIGGATFWVDANKELHWQDPAKAQIVLNPGFDGGSSTSWSLDSAAAVTADVGPGGTGDHALVTTGNGSGQHFSTQTITGIASSRRYMIILDMVSSVAAKAVVVLDWYNGATPVRTGDTVTSSGTSWNRYKAIFTSPVATVDRVIVKLGGVNNFTGTTRHDNIQLLGETAAFGVSTTPNGTTTKKLMNWSEKREAVVPINRVLINGTGVSGWRENLASISYYRGKKYEGVVNDEGVTDSAGIDAAALEVWRKYAFPARSGSYFTLDGGLQAGTWQIIEHEVFGLQAIEYLSTVTTQFLGNGNMGYTVNYGQPEEDAGSAMASIASVFTGTGSSLPGTPPPPGVDTTPPSLPTITSVTSPIIYADDGSSVLSIRVALTQPTDADFWATWVEFTSDSEGGENPTPVWTAASSILVGKERVQADLVGVPGGTKFWVRARSQDTSGNYSTGGPLNDGYTAVQSIVTGVDAEAPAIPATIVLSGGFKSFGLVIKDSPPPDLSYYQIRYAKDDGSGTGPGSNPWTYVNTASQTTVIPDLDVPNVSGTPGAGTQLYWMQVRAVDTSGNVYGSLRPTGTASNDTFTVTAHALAVNDTVRFLSLTGGTGLSTDTTYYVINVTTDTFQLSTSQGGGAFNFTTDVTASQLVLQPTEPMNVGNPEAGWTARASVTATLIGASNIVANSITTNEISTGGLSADVIKSGYLQIDTGDSAKADGVHIYDTGVLVGKWDENGLIVDQDSGPRLTNYVKITNASIMVYKSGIAVTAITPDGITADAIRLGYMPGGNNHVLNSSFELAAFGAAAPETAVWTTTFDTDYGQTNSTAQDANPVNALTIKSNTYS